MAKRTTTAAGPQDRESFQRQLEPHLDGLYRTALRMTGDATRAEDVLQDAVLKAWRFYGSFTQGTNFRAWMHRVLYTIFVNTTRDRGPRPAPLESSPEPVHIANELLEELERPHHRARESAIFEAVDECIVRAVQELPPDLRLVFTLSTIEGLKYREIAEVMDCPLGTVMSRLFRSRKVLQDKLVDYARAEGFAVTDSEAKP